ncbi:VTT domain-containing protein [Candidatus Pelagibacter sp.]|nr:VTT domain-containing protein [Candidatus Pelagibacter sp.]
MKNLNLKIILGSLYLAILSIFLYFLFSKFNIEDISSIKIIQSNMGELNQIKDNDLILIIFIFFIITIIWVLLLGFGTPIALIGGFVFGKWLGTFLTVLSLTTGALCLYMVGKYFFYDFLKTKLLIKFKHLEKMFKDKHLIIMIIFRFVGFVPFSIANLLPVIFNINSRNYYLGTFIGILPAIFVVVSLGSGLSDAIYQFDVFPSFFSLISLPEIYLPILGFIGILIISFFVKLFLNK